MITATTPTPDRPNSALPGKLHARCFRSLLFGDLRITCWSFREYNREKGRIILRYHTGDSTLRRSRASTASLLALRAALTLFITLAGLAMATVFHTEPNASAMPAPTGVASASARIAPAVSRMASEGNRSAQVAPRQAPEITPTALTTPEQQTFDLINQRRVAMGLQAFRLDWNLTAAAR